MIYLLIFVILTGATAFVVFLKVKNASSLFQHLTVDDIKAYKRGHLTQEDRRRVTRHISYCSSCRDLMLETDPDDE